MHLTMKCYTIIIALCVPGYLTQDFITYGPSSRKRLFYFEKKLIASYEEGQRLCKNMNAILGNQSTT